MRGFGCCPAPEEDVEADEQVGERDEAEAVVAGAVDGLEDDLDVEFGWLDCGGRSWLGAGGGGAGRTQDGIVGAGEGAVGEKATLVGGDARDRVVVDGLHDVALADAGALALGLGGNAGGAEAGSGFDPPDAVGGDAVGGLGREIQPGEHTGSQGGRGQNHGENAGLESILHRC